MSAKGRGPNCGGPNSFFPTPHWCTRAFLQTCNALPACGTFYDPCAGSGDIIIAAKEILPCPQWLAGELRPATRTRLATIAEEVIIEDFFKVKALHADVIVMNPPFELALEFVEKALMHADHVCVLVRMGFLASIKRADFLRGQMPDVYVLPRRPSFTATGATDACDYCWLHFGPNRYRKRGRIEVIDADLCSG